MQPSLKTPLLIRLSAPRVKRGVRVQWPGRCSPPSPTRAGGTGPPGCINEVQPCTRGKNAACDGLTDSQLQSARLASHRDRRSGTQNCSSAAALQGKGRCFGAREALLSARTPAFSLLAVATPPESPGYGRVRADTRSSPPARRRQLPVPPALGSPEDLRCAGGGNTPRFATGLSVSLAGLSVSLACAAVSQQAYVVNRGCVCFQNRSSR